MEDRWTCNLLSRCSYNPIVSRVSVVYGMYILVTSTVTKYVISTTDLQTVSEHQMIQMKLGLTQRVHVPNNWALRTLVIGILVKVSDKCMIIGHLDP